jgi:lipid II:glycine glycyltransferase (peptidoglycan interpeptide bridge formation enzyme)
MLSYKNYQLIKPNSLQKEQISKVIKKNNGAIFHDVHLNEIVAEQFNTELFYLVDDPTNISTLSPVHKESMKNGMTRYHLKPLYDMPYAGFVGENEFCSKNFSKGFFDAIIYVGFPYEKEFNINSDKVRAGETCMVDLSLSEDDIFNKVIHSKRRNMIRKAQKEGIIIKCFKDEDGLKEFWPILGKLHDKLGYDQLTFDYYNKIILEYGPKGEAFILVAYKNGETISGVFIIGNKNYMHYYKGASMFEVKNEGQGELLQWEAIKLSKSLKAKYYDLCNLNKQALPAIYKFKTGISNEIYQYPIYSDNSIGFKIIRRVKTFL